MCLQSKSTNDKQYLDNEWSIRMTWDRTQFKSLEKKDEGFVIFGYNTREKIIGIGIIGNENVNIFNILLVDDLKHNLLSISQLCDKDYYVKFRASYYSILDPSTNEVAFMSFRFKNVYTVDLSKLFYKGKKIFFGSNKRICIEG